jgi:hypothetical protein
MSVVSLKNAESRPSGASMDRVVAVKRLSLRTRVLIGATVLTIARKPLPPPIWPSPP